jgi:hypothetical protein
LDGGAARAWACWLWGGSILNTTLPGVRFLLPKRAVFLLQRELVGGGALLAEGKADQDPLQLTGQDALQAMLAGLGAP